MGPKTTKLSPEFKWMPKLFWCKTWCFTQQTQHGPHRWRKVNRSTARWCGDMRWFEVRRLLALEGPVVNLRRFHVSIPFGTFHVYTGESDSAGQRMQLESRIGTSRRGQWRRIRIRKREDAFARCDGGGNHFCIFLWYDDDRWGRKWQVDLSKLDDRLAHWSVKLYSSSQGWSFPARRTDRGRVQLQFFRYAGNYAWFSFSCPAFNAGVSSKFRNPPLLFGKNDTLFVKACRVILRDRAARLETARPRRRFWNCAPTWMVWSVSGTTTSGWGASSALFSPDHVGLAPHAGAVKRLAGSSVRWRFCASPSRRRPNRHGTGVARSVENTVGIGCFGR